MTSGVRSSRYQRILGHPLIYEKIRPLVVGGIDMSPLFKLLEADPEDIILDIGAGTGMALEHLPRVRQYHGFDTDARAIDYALRRPEAKRDGVKYEARRLSPVDLGKIRPTRVILSGILHHLSDDEAIELLSQCDQSNSILRIVTSDPVFVPGAWLNNLFGRLDRGKHVRTIEEQVGLIKKTGLRVDAITVTRSHPKRGRAIYLMTALSPANREAELPHSTAAESAG
jgi:SAM-dependent methyltransferase